VRIDEISIDSVTATINFDAPSFGIATPTNLTVNYRSQSAQGLFLPQSTSYNPVTHKLSVTLALTGQGGDFGEFIFCYPDVADVPYLPILNEVESYRGVQPVNVIAPAMATTGVTYSVNEQLPISLSWSPKGFARSYKAQISSDQTFSTALVDIAYQTQANYVWTGASFNSTYFYRVKTVNEGGESDWAVGSFHTVAPVVSVNFPNGGEALQRGLKYFIRWSDNIAENVNIDLYKGGVFSKGIATNITSIGAFQWQISFDITPGSDYTIKVSSATNSALSDLSDSNFIIIDAPIVNPGSIVRLADGRVQFGITAPGASQVTVLGSSNLTVWQVLQSVPLSGGSAMFTDDAATNLVQRFYRLRVPEGKIQVSIGAEEAFRSYPAPR